MKFDIANFGRSSSSIDDFFKETPKHTVAASRIRIASCSDLDGFFQVAQDKLVHLSQKDFWHLGQDEQGYYVERLVDDSAGPVKG
jgi:hypothetical protein